MDASTRPNGKKICPASRPGFRIVAGFSTALLVIRTIPSRSRGLARVSTARDFGDAFGVYSVGVHFAVTVLSVYEHMVVRPPGGPPVHHAAFLLAGHERTVYAYIERASSALQMVVSSRPA